MNGSGDISTDTRSRLMGLLAAILLLPVYFLLAHFDNENRGFVVVCAVGVILSVLYARREVATEAWFLISIAVLGAVELLGAAFIPIPTHIPGAAMIPISILNAVVILGIVSAIEKLVVANRTAKS